jgi:hypothetical protein
MQPSSVVPLSTSPSVQAVDRSASGSLGKILQSQCAPLRSADSDHSSDGWQWTEGNASLGQYADGLITDPKTWKEHKAEFQKGASDASKDPARMPVFIEQYVVVGRQERA